MGPRRTEGSAILLRGSRVLLYRPKKITLAGHQHQSPTRRHLEVNEKMMQRAVEVL